ncbi:MAG: hypothetical protein M3R35_08550, partial [Candidatus Eremiobacteraeota bacterium]|nr:hypothetical protein [Candidatus Eremiobacteraeota bacterium]
MNVARGIIGLLLVLAIAPASSRAAGPFEQARWTVSTRDPIAQTLFDRGLTMLYAFDIGDARALFGQAVRRDPKLLLGYWGLAQAETMDINRPTTPEGERRGARAVARGRAYIRYGNPEERALFGAIAKRYSGGQPSLEMKRYAAAMTSFAKPYHDANALVLAAFAQWNGADALVDSKSALTAPARTMLTELNGALARDPKNLGAHHLRI